MAMISPKRTVIVKIGEGDYAGLEMVLSVSISMGDFIDFLHKRGSDEATLEEQAEGFEWFGDNVLVSWNLTEEDGKTPVPAGWAGLKTIDPALVLTIANKWRDAVTDTGAPLGRPSNGSRSRPRSSRRRSS